LGATQVRAASLSYCDTISSNLVVNCGFETGDFTAWSLSENDVPGEQGNLYGVEGTDPINNTSPDGSYQAYIADLVSNSTTLSQSLATVAGDEYAISFFLLQDTAPVGGYSNDLSVSFGGDVLVTDLGVPAQVYYFGYHFYGVASSNSTTLSITLGNDLGRFLLDDVLVTSAPEPSTWVLAFSGAALVFLFRRKSGHNYFKNLLRPISHRWKAI
jgi:hypothetical protein